MFIDLFWKNINNVDTVLKIYRGDTPLDTENLPETPVAVLENGEETWRDENVLLGKTYYYVFETSSAEDVHVTRNYPIKAINRRGVGPSDIIDGDANLGYFGSVQSGTLLTTNQLKEKVGLTAGVVNQPFPIWHKFIRNNKILYIPNAPLIESLSYNQLWNLGLVFGKDEDTNPFATARKTTIEIGADTFIVRLMTGYLDGNYETWDNNVNQSNEFDDLVYPLAHSVMDGQKLNNIFTNGQKWTEFFPNGTPVVMVQEAISNNVSALRGTPKTTANDDAIVDMRTFYEGRVMNAPRTTAANRWWPVLELVETKPEETSPEIPTGEE